MELSPVGADENDRYKKITLSLANVQRLLVSLFIQEHEHSIGVPEEIVLDIDATHDPITARNLWLSMAQAFPLQELFAAAHARLRRPALAAIP